jgi:hypothetical protein
MQKKLKKKSSDTKMSKSSNSIAIAIDFDGTIVKHEYPEVGRAVPGALEWIRKFKEAGAKVILFTMRSDMEERSYLQEAVDYIEEGGITLDGVNVNPDQKSWTKSPKAYAQVYIDDAAFGCPLKIDVINGYHVGRPYVNWDKVGPKVLESIVASE